MGLLKRLGFSAFRNELLRPRERGSAKFAALEGRILRELFRNSPIGEDA